MSETAVVNQLAEVVAVVLPVVALLVAVVQPDLVVAAIHTCQSEDVAVEVGSDTAAVVAVDSL